MTSTTSNDNGYPLNSGSEELRSNLQMLKDEQTTTESALGPIDSSNRKKYSVIRQESREKLLDLVLKKRMKIKEAAKLCGLKFSTSKAILATYRKEGRVGKKKTRARKTKVINTVIVAEVNPFDPTQTKFIPMVSVSETKMVSCEKESSMNEQDARKSSELVGQAQAAYMQKGLDNETVKEMMEVAATNARISVLNDVQSLLYNLSRTTGNPQFTLFHLRGAIQSMNQNFKMCLENQVSKRKMNNYSHAPPQQQNPQVQTHPIQSIVRPKAILPKVEHGGMFNQRMNQPTMQGIAHPFMNNTQTSGKMLPNA